jgi:DNA-binding response OmpR family regulator
MASDSTQGEPLTILLVEDDPNHAELILRGLQNHRVASKVYHVDDGEAAQNYLFRRGGYADPQQSPHPHVVLLDLRLPKVDGLELLREIKTSEDLKQIPVVILTSSHAEQDVVKAYQYYANSYLVKPVDFDQFNKLMDDLGFYWLAWNHYPWSEPAR